ncbi:hypothetical protein ACQCVH_18190 [Bacillus infantis]|uniref:hypothetical protein n=1 Tax=Bacillus infantis TaxID=324767 RepID=UPI003CF047F9
MTEEQICPQCCSAESATGEFKGYRPIIKKKTVLKYSEAVLFFVRNTVIYILSK